ncbi:MAG TPA: tetratricopeptide repeat protein [Acidobacteriota bacterium]|nr:tetratricopeptide repeat protein [Acidobacteriota bacterium]
MELKEQNIYGNFPCTQASMNPGPGDAKKPGPPGSAERMSWTRPVSHGGRLRTMNWKTLKLAVALIVLATVAAPAVMAQEASAEGQDPEQYRIEYTAYQDAIKKTGQEKVEALLKFYRDFPKSSLLPYIKGEYLQILQAAYNEGKAAETVTLGERFMQVEPGEIAPVYFSADLLFRQGNYADALPWAERLYKEAEKADFKKRATFMAAFASLQTGKTAKLQKYGPEAVDQFAAKDTYLISTELMRQAVSSNNLRQAAQYANKALEGYGAAESSASAEMREYIGDNRVAATMVLGEAAYVQGQWNRAIQQFQRVLQLTSEKEKTGQAYYKIGMSHWKAGKVDPEAMRAFARGYKLGSGQFSQQCYKHLEDLYKIRHNDSTAGLDEFIQESLTE